MTSEGLQGEEQFHSKNYLLEMPRSHAKIRLKSAPQKLNFLMAKDISKSYTLDFYIQIDITLTIFQEKFQNHPF